MVKFSASGVVSELVGIAKVVQQNFAVNIFGGEVV
jgi:hypothetical protein